MEKKVNVWESFDMIDRIQPGSNVSEAVSVSDCKVLRLSDASGDGIMTVYQVFEGVYLMFNDFHLRECQSGYQAAETVFCIDHCREGAIEKYYVAGKAYCMKPGSISLDTRVHHQGRTVFPNCHFHGITIGFEEGYAQKSINEFAPKLDINLKELAEKYCPNNETSIFSEDKTFESIIYPLYHLTGNVELDYLKVKVLEILIFLKSWNPRKQDDDEPYVFAEQAAKIRGIQEYITSNLEENLTQSELAKRFGITESAMKKGFKQIYGENIHTYLKAYRLQQAALILKNNPDLPISEIALQVGYSSHSKFTAAFREQFKMTPQEYRLKV